MGGNGGKWGSPEKGEWGGNGGDDGGEDEDEDGDGDIAMAIIRYCGSGDVWRWRTGVFTEYLLTFHGYSMQGAQEAYFLAYATY